MISSNHSPQNHSAHVYNDFSGLNKLRYQASEDPDGALEAVARQFESIFLKQILQSMRQANEVFAEGNYLNSNESQFYQEMFDEQITQTMTESRSIGIADALVRQLRGVPDEVAMQHAESDGDEPADMGTSIQNYARNIPPMHRELPERLEEVDRIIAEQGESADAGDTLPARFESPEDFVRNLLPIAKQVSEESGISPRLMIAQAALETGWGRHMIEDDSHGASHNLFGIKADRRWDGDSVGIVTTEFRDGVPMRETDRFRAYDDYEHSFRDYVQFLNENPRYENVLKQAHDPVEFARGLRDAGYATDPEYDQKIERIMDGQHLRSALDEPWWED